MLKLHDYISMDSFGPIMTVKQKLKQEMAFALKLVVFTVVKKEKKKKKKKRCFLSQETTWLNWIKKP